MKTYEEEAFDLYDKIQNFIIYRDDCKQMTIEEFCNYLLDIGNGFID
jgi:hypothetical protein